MSFQRILTSTLIAIVAFASLALAQEGGSPDSTAGAAKAAVTKPAAEPAAAAAKTMPAAKAAPAATVDAAVKSIDAQIAKLKVDRKDPTWKMHLTIPTKATFDPAKKYYARMVTNKGALLIQFKPDVAPMHVTNFIYLARLGFYDGLKFHRAMKGFMAQGGDPAGNGTGGPGYQFAGEFSPKAKHDKAGILSTANAGPNTDGSQFFIMYVPYPSLDMHYSIFGEVVEGLDVLKAMEAVSNPGDGPPTSPLAIDKVTIEVK